MSLTFDDPIDKLRIQHGRSTDDKFYDAVRGGILQRFCGRQDSWSDSFARHVGHIPRDADQFIGRSIPDIAEHFCERAGVRPKSRAEAVHRAFTLRSAHHLTADFPNIMLDAQAKTLRKAYEESPSSYEQWTSRGESAPSFRDLHRVVFGEFSLPEEVPVNMPYPEANVSDARESYGVRKHGQLFSVSMEAFVNDDVQAIRRTPEQQGNSMKRSINRDVYTVLTTNPTLRDGVTLFHSSSHGENFDSTALAAGSPIDTGFAVMGLQTGLDSTNVLGLVPQFLIVPMALSATALKITRDLYQPTTAADVNLHAASGPRPLRVVMDGQIDALGSSTNWWMAANPAHVDTVEVTFLEGEEAPILEQQSGFETDTVTYKIRQTYGVKAIDYRGLYQGNS